MFLTFPSSDISVLRQAPLTNNATDSTGLDIDAGGAAPTDATFDSVLGVKNNASGVSVRYDFTAGEQTALKLGGQMRFEIPTIFFSSLEDDTDGPCGSSGYDHVLDSGNPSLSKETIFFVNNDSSNTAGDGNWQFRLDIGTSGSPNNRMTSSGGSVFGNSVGTIVTNIKALDLSDSEFTVVEVMWDNTEYAIYFNSILMVRETYTTDAGMWGSMWLGSDRAFANRAIETQFYRNFQISSLIPVFTNVSSVIVGDIGDSLGAEGERFFSPIPESGAHDGANDAAVLADSGESWIINQWVGFHLTNTTDGSSTTVTENDANTATGVLSGGTDNDWDTGDLYVMSKNSANVSAPPIFNQSFENKLAADDAAQGVETTWVFHSIGGYFISEIDGDASPGGKIIDQVAGPDSNLLADNPTTVHLVGSSNDASKSAGIGADFRSSLDTIINTVMAHASVDIMTLSNSPTTKANDAFDGPVFVANVAEINGHYDDAVTAWYDANPGSDKVLVVAERFTEMGGQSPAEGLKTSPFRGFQTGALDNRHTGAIGQDNTYTGIKAALAPLTPKVILDYPDLLSLEGDVISVDLKPNLLGETIIEVGFDPAIPSGLSETDGVVTGTITTPMDVTEVTVTARNGFNSIISTFKWTTLTTGDPSTGINVPINS